jgi:hypothetical protein
VNSEILVRKDGMAYVIERNAMHLRDFTTERLKVKLMPFKRGAQFGSGHG